MSTNKALARQLARAARLDLEPELARFVERWCDAAEQGAGGHWRFHWGRRSKHTELHLLPEPEPVVAELGSLVAVTYRTRKALTSADWEHHFLRPLPSLAAGPSGQLYIIGGKYRVTARGIEG